MQKPDAQDYPVSTWLSTIEAKGPEAGVIEHVRYLGLDIGHSSTPFIEDKSGQKGASQACVCGDACSQDGT